MEEVGPGLLAHSFFSTPCENHTTPHADDHHLHGHTPGRCSSRPKEGEEKECRGVDNTERQRGEHCINNSLVQMILHHRF